VLYRLWLSKRCQNKAVIPQAFIQELLSRVDVVDVVGRSVTLKKAGANYQGLCPFHNEKSPSFSVSPAKQFYHCFGCGAHGSALGFLMEHQGLSYVDAIKDLAGSVGLTVPEEKQSSPENRASPDLFELMALAEKYYRNRLKDSPRAIEYFKGRGLSGQIAARFGLGYSPDSWRGLESAVPDYRNPDLVKVGLVIESPADGEKDEKRYDRFRDRVMFPIRNPRGQTIGFGGRILDKGEPKYLNSPETPLFSKGRELYGLFEGRDELRKENTAIVVEGYMDVVMLAQHGVGNAVATLGTATTSDHVRKLSRLVDRIVFSFDGDKAGRKAAWRALEACLPQLSDTKRIDFLFLPAEHDPDTFVKEHGEEAFREMLDNASSFSGFMLGTLAERNDIETAEGRAQFLAEARPLIQAMPEIALKLQLQRQVALKSSVSDAELQQFLAVKPTTGFVPALKNSKPDVDPQEGMPADAPAAGKQFSGKRAWTKDWQKPDRMAIGAIRSKAAPVKLIRRSRLLTLLHPLLAKETLEKLGVDRIPEELSAWIAALSQCNVGSFAGLCDVLRAEFPEQITEVEIDAASDKALIAEMSHDEAYTEYLDSIHKLRARQLRQESNDLMMKIGLNQASAEDMQRYRDVMVIIAKLHPSE
jgi:DNA primase